MVLRVRTPLRQPSGADRDPLAAEVHRMSEIMDRQMLDSDLTPGSLNVFRSLSILTRLARCPQNARGAEWRISLTHMLQELREHLHHGPLNDALRRDLTVRVEMLLAHRGLSVQPCRKRCAPSEVDAFPRMPSPLPQPEQVFKPVRLQIHQRLLLSEFVQLFEQGSRRPLSAVELAAQVTRFRSSAGRRQNQIGIILVSTFEPQGLAVRAGADERVRLCLDRPLAYWKPTQRAAQLFQKS